ncbi:MAG: ribonuclease J [Candidatus Melainabacteria bacterium]|nr:ribonuclease J [Candidatus Melainabacteria bacterium]
MAHIATGTADIQYDSLALIPLGGQNELGQLLWILSFGGDLILIDAGAAYPSEDLPGVDLLFPNTNFLEANQDRILALLLTNGHEEHCGAVNYLLRHLDIPKVMAPRFVSQLLSQSNLSSPTKTAEQQLLAKVLDTIELRQPYQIGPFEVEWMNVNNAIADACALRIGTPEGAVIYTSSFKLDQTPVDKRFLDINGLAGSGDKGVLVLISDSAGVENKGYTPSEISVKSELVETIENATGRVIVVFPGSNTHRLQILFDVALQTGRKVVLAGESLVATALSAVVTGNLIYDRQIEASVEELNELPDAGVLILATGIDEEPLQVLDQLAYGKNPDVKFKEGDVLIYSANIVPGKLRHMANILDQLLALGVKAIHGGKLHVSKHASREELKLMLSITRPRYFIPAIGEGRHVMHHAQLAIEWGMDQDNVFPISDGDILVVKNGVASQIGTIESQAVLYNREQGERVTTFSVQERRALSMEGVVTVSLAVNGEGKVVSGPSITAGASGFVKSKEWDDTRSDLRALILSIVDKFVSTPREGNGLPLGALKTALRETVMKTLRSKMQSKPTVQVVVHDVS